MAYQSTHAGSEIDQAVTEVQNRIWGPLKKEVIEENWVGVEAPYTFDIEINVSDSNYSVSPMIWFMDKINNNRYYCDYSVDTNTSNKYIITIKSNIKINGIFYIFGIIGSIVN